MNSVDMLPVPISPIDCNRKILDSAFALLPPKMDSGAARVMLLSIGLQESGLSERVQRGNGPARGLFQFEQGGGVKGVMTHPSSKDIARQVCVERGVPFERKALWESLANDDILAAVMARLLLWTDSKPMPTNSESGWQLYSRVWRPGRPHPERWPSNYTKAQKAVNG